MIELRKYLYESLLDDEDDIISKSDKSFIEDWEEIADLKKVDKISAKYAREYKVEKNGKITVGELSVKFGNQAKVIELFPPSIEFKSIKSLVLSYRGVTDIHDKNIFSIVPDVVDDLYIDFGRVGTNPLHLEKLELKNTKKITVDAFQSDPSVIKFSPNNRYKRLDIKLHTKDDLTNLESIEGLNCEVLVIHSGLKDSNGKEYTKDMSVRTSNQPHIPMANKFEILYDNFKRKNKVDRLLVCKGLNILSEVVLQDINGHKRYNLERVKK